MSLTSSEEQLAYSDFSDTEETADEVNKNNEEARHGVKRRQQQTKGLPAKQAHFSEDDEDDGNDDGDDVKDSKNTNIRRTLSNDDDEPPIKIENGVCSDTDDDDSGVNGQKGTTKPKNNNKKKANTRGHFSTSARATTSGTSAQNQSQNEYLEGEEYAELAAFCDNCDSYCELRKWAAETMLSLGETDLGKACAEDKVIARDELEHEKEVLQLELLTRLRGELREALMARHAILLNERKEPRASVENTEFAAMLLRGVGNGKKSGGSSAKKKGNAPGTMAAGSTLRPSTTAMTTTTTTTVLSSVMPEFCVKKEECMDDLNAINMGIELKLK